MIVRPGRPASLRVLSRQRDVLIERYAATVRRHARGRRAASAALKIITHRLLWQELRFSAACRNERRQGRATIDLFAGAA